MVSGMQAVRERKAAIRKGDCYQARVPPVPLAARPPGVEADDPRCGVLGPGPAELLASVVGPERAAADELPMDARMDPDARAPPGARPRLPASRGCAARWEPVCGNVPDGVLRIVTCCVLPARHH